MIKIILNFYIIVMYLLIIYLYYDMLYFITMTCKNKCFARFYHIIALCLQSHTHDTRIYARKCTHGTVAYVRRSTKVAKKKNNTWDSNVVPHRSTNQARRCLTSLSRREAVLSSLYGRSCLRRDMRSYINPLLLKK